MEMSDVIGLGCMRLSTSADRDDERSVRVIHTALDAGATLLDTSDAYCRDDRETGHNERLIARALATWQGDRARITVATKGGIRRPKGAWITDGRARHLADACDASRAALGVETIDLYQLHAVDPKTPVETSVRALARLQNDGKVRDIGLCNVTVNQIRAAQRITRISSVQASLSPFDDENLRNGVAEFCRDNGIRFIAHRPLGGERVSRLARNGVLVQVAEKHAATVEEIALAWLMSFGRGVVPVPGATRAATASSLASAVAIQLDETDRAALDREFSGRLLRVPRDQRSPRSNATGDVVVVMGMPGAGKTTIAHDLERAGYARLNRDTLGGTLSDLVPRLHDAIAAGHARVVLDNTYPTRKSRNEVIEAAWECGVPVRCIWQTTALADAQINSIQRMIEVHGSLPTPEEIRAMGKTDPRYLLPDAQFRYERIVEAPTLEEGFTSVEEQEFARTPSTARLRALVLNFDDLVGSAMAALSAGDVAVDRSRAIRLGRYREEGWRIFVHMWRPQVERKETTTSDVEECIRALRVELGNQVDVACCTHDAGPPACWCRKPVPGSVIEFAMRRSVALDRSIVVGSSAADRTMAERVGAAFERTDVFFS